MSPEQVFEYTSISEEALLAEGLSLDELRALRLLTHDKDSRSNASYLAQVELIARAKGAGGSIARSVKGANLADRALNPPIRANGWSPPYELALQILRGAPPPDTYNGESRGACQRFQRHARAILTGSGARWRIAAPQRPEHSRHSRSDSSHRDDV